MLQVQDGKAGKRGIDLKKTVPVKLGPASENQISDMAARLMPKSMSYMFTSEIGRVLAAQNLDVRQAHKKLLEIKAAFDAVASSPAAVKAGGIQKIMENAEGGFYTNFARLISFHPGFVSQLAKQTDFFDAEDMLYKNGILEYLTNHSKDAGWIAKSGPIKTRFLLLVKMPRLADIIVTSEFGDAMVKNPKATCEALEWILKQCASREKQANGILRALGHLMRGEPSFADDPGLFARNIIKLNDALSPLLSAKAYGNNWDNISYAFNSHVLSKKFFKEPGRVVQDITAYVEALCGKSAEPRFNVYDAFYSLSGPLADELASSPASAIKIAKHFGSASPDAPINAISIINYDRSHSILSLYKKNPERIISALSAIHQLTYDKVQKYDSGLSWIYGSEKAFSFFASNPELCVKMARAFKVDFRDAAEFMVDWQPVRERLVKYPERTIGMFQELLSSVPPFARDELIGALFNDNSGSLISAFEKDRKKIGSALSEIAKGTAVVDKSGHYNNSYMYSMIRDMGNGIRPVLFSTDSHLYVMAAQELGSNANSFMGLFERNANLYLSHLAKDPGGTIAIVKGMQGIEANDLSVVFELLNLPPFEAAFAANAQKTVAAISKIKKEAGSLFHTTPAALGEENSRLVAQKWLSGKLPDDAFFVAMKSSKAYAVELGRKLDELHEPRQVKERMAYLSSLSKTDVLSLLLSDPVYFYPSSNNLLFDRLKTDFPGRKISSVVAEYGLAGARQELNLLFRSINYNRFSGTANSLFSKEELASIMPVLFAPLKKSGFDATYYYLLANSLRSLKDAWLGTKLAKMLNDEMPRPSGKGKGLLPDDTRKAAAIDFLTKAIQDLDKVEQSCVFDPRKYTGKDGRLRIIQVFDKDDTSDDKGGGHWQLTKEWFSAYGGRAIGANGKALDKKGLDAEQNQVAFETPAASITLFMSDDSYAVCGFIKKELKKDPHFILTFRGHIFSLKSNIPYDIFDNNPDAQVLFIPGNCGSAGSVPDYMQANSKSDLSFIGYSSTGYGQVTNAILDILLSEAAAKRQKLRSYEEIIKKNDFGMEKILQQKGDPSTIKTTTIGEQMLVHVNKEYARLMPNSE